jgi:hydrogenase maturation factor
MCQAPVGKVIGVGPGSLTVEYNGKSRILRSKLPGVKPGDYVLFSTDIAIDTVDEEEAMSILGKMK